MSAVKADVRGGSLRVTGEISEAQLRRQVRIEAAQMSIARITGVTCFPYMNGDTSEKIAVKVIADQLRALAEMLGEPIVGAACAAFLLDLQTEDMLNDLDQDAA